MSAATRIRDLIGALLPRMGSAPARQLSAEAQVIIEVLIQEVERLEARLDRLEGRK